MRKIKITIARDGTQKIEVLGASGDDCLELTRALEKRLGRPEGERTFKPEFDATVGEEEVDREEERSS